MSRQMHLEVGTAASRICTFKPVEHASAYLLAHGTEETPLADAAAQKVLDIAHQGFRDVRASPHVDDPRDRFQALLALYAGILAANSILGKSEGRTGASFVGAAIRGTMLYLTSVGSAHVHRLGRRGLTELIDTASTPGAALGLVPQVTSMPFAGAWEQGDVLILSCGTLVEAIEPKLIARATLEAANLTEAAHQLVAHATSSASLALVRWH